jgi:trimethylamine--corrinoid protein Co-methyltransferase
MSKKRHLDMLMAHMTLAIKPFMGSVNPQAQAPARAAASRYCSHCSAENVADNCVMTSLIGINSPLTFGDDI